MKTPNTAALAAILRTTEKNVNARARKLGITTDCGRCVRGFYSGGMGNCQCWTCGGTAEVVDTSDAGLDKARAIVASGALDAYLAGLEAERAAKAADAAEAKQRRADAVRRAAEASARYSSLRAEYKRLRAEAVRRGVSDVATRADIFADRAAQIADTLDVCSDRPLTRASALLAQVVEALDAVVAEHRAADFCETSDADYAAALRRADKFAAADRAAEAWESAFGGA